MYMTNSMPYQPVLVKSTVVTPAEHKMNLQKRGAWLEAMIKQSENNFEAAAGFELDYDILQRLLKETVSEDVIRARCEKLAELKKTLGLRITDSRITYTSQTSRAVKALCGGAV